MQSGREVTDLSVTADGFGRFLIDVFEEWVRHDVGRVYVQMFDVALANWHGEPPSLCVHSQTCGNALALEHTGDVYSCDHFVEPNHLLGNINDKSLLTLVNLPQQRRFGQDKHDSLPRYCRECDVRFACHGGCPKDRFLDTPDGEPGLNYLCAGFQAFFRHIDWSMRAHVRPAPAGARAGRHHGRCTPARTPNVPATTRAPAATAGNGSVVTAPTSPPTRSG